MRRLRQFLSRKLNWVALTLVGIFLALALAAPALSPPIDPENPADFQIHEGWVELVPQPRRLPWGQLYTIEAASGVSTCSTLTSFTRSCGGHVACSALD